MYWELRQIEANFGAYHKFKQSPDTLYLTFFALSSNHNTSKRNYRKQIVTHRKSWSIINEKRHFISHK
jgi:hypothetical protein